MPNYRFEAKIHSRANTARTATEASAYRSGKPLMEKVAYRSGERLRDRQDKIYDYTRKQGIEHTEIMLPANAPERLKDRQTLWHTVEAKEDKSTRPESAQFAREFIITLPRELSIEDNIKLAREFCQKQFVSRGIIVDLAVHDVEASDGERNPHAHAMTMTRRWDEHKDNFGNKARDLNKDTLLHGWRKAWADHANKALEAAGIDERIDHRSLAERRQEALEQGDKKRAAELDREPGVPLGGAKHAKNGKKYNDREYGDWDKRVAANKQIEHRNAMRERLNWQQSATMRTIQTHTIRQTINQSQGWVPDMPEIEPQQDWGVIDHER